MEQIWYIIILQLLRRGRYVSDSKEQKYAYSFTSNIVKLEVKDIKTHVSENHEYVIDLFHWHFLIYLYTFALYLCIKQISRFLFAPFLRLK